MNATLQLSSTPVESLVEDQISELDYTDSSRPIRKSKIGKVKAKKRSGSDLHKTRECWLVEPVVHGPIEGERLDFAGRPTVTFANPVLEQDLSATVRWLHRS